MKQKQVRSEQLRAMFADLANEICNTTEKVVLSLKGNTITIDLSEAVINISCTVKGGER